MPRLFAPSVMVALALAPQAALSENEDTLQKAIRSRSQQGHQPGADRSVLPRSSRGGNIGNAWRTTSAARIGPRVGPETTGESLQRPPGAREILPVISYRGHASAHVTQRHSDASGRAGRARAPTL